MTTVARTHFEHSSRSEVFQLGETGTRGKVESSLPLAVIKSTAGTKKCWRGHGSARIDQAPEDEPVFHAPETTACNADLNISMSWDRLEADTELVHVPAYSLALPEMVALQAPFQVWADLLADQAPCSRILPLASCSVQAPVTPLLW